MENGYKEKRILFLMKIWMGFSFLSVKNEKIKLKNEENLINFQLDLSILFHYLVY